MKPPGQMTIKTMLAPAEGTCTNLFYKSALQNPFFGQLKRTAFGINLSLPGQAKGTGGTPPPAQPGSSSDGPKPKKPMMRNLLATRTKWLAFGAFVWVMLIGLNWHVSVKQCRKKHYLAFYRCYDPTSDFERMKRVGMFQSISPDGAYNRIS